MKIAAVICEFNPFHNGHAALAAMAREEGFDCVVGIMSGNYVQRGEPAIMPVTPRITTALKNGYDVIIRLPVSGSVSGAEGFARAGVYLADSLGCVDSLFFASECADTELLKKAASIIDSPETDALIKTELEKGVTYAAARESAVRSISPRCADALKEPNNILGVEYIRALNRIGSAVEPRAVKRLGPGHGDGIAEGSFASASEIRRRIFSGEEWEKFTPDDNGYGTLNLVDMHKYETAVLYKLRTASAEELRSLPDVSEGLENRMLSAAQNAVSLEEFYSLVKTKRYTRARIRRAALCALLGITAPDAREEPSYIRILGFNETGAQAVKAIKESASLPVMSKTADIKDFSERAKKAFELECRASDIYSLLLTEPLPCGEERRFTVKKAL